MAIVVTAPWNVNDADTTELNALEKLFKIISEGDLDYFPMMKAIMYLSRQ